jgi:hypothetical protein
VLDDKTSPRESMRKMLFETFRNTKIFNEGESLLDTYEALLRSKIEESDSTAGSAKNPIENFEETALDYGYGEYTDRHSGKTLYSTDALRIHELFDPNKPSGEMFGQIMSVLEKLWLVHILRSFERLEYLGVLRDTAFFIDGPLAVFSTSAWLAPQIRKELKRINEKQKALNGLDLAIIGLEKSGAFKNHMVALDTNGDGSTGRIDPQTIFLLDDKYIKKNIVYSPSEKQYGKDTYFGRKLFYKAKNGYLLVPVIASLDERQFDLSRAAPDQYPRLADIAALLDEVVSNRYPDSLGPIVSAHAEAAIPLSLGTKIFQEIAKEIRDHDARHG